MILNKIFTAKNQKGVLAIIYFNNVFEFNT